MNEKRRPNTSKEWSSICCTFVEGMAEFSQLDQLLGQPQKLSQFSKLKQANKYKPGMVDLGSSITVKRC